MNYTQRIDIYGTRYYLDKSQDGIIQSVVPSVTTVIDAFRNKGLDIYVNKFGKEELKKKADLGTAIHCCIEDFINGFDITYSLFLSYIPNNFNNRYTTKELIEGFEKIARICNYVNKELLNTQSDNIVTEQCLIGNINDCKVAGTVDYYDKDNNVIIDWKSGYVKELSSHYTLQLAIYSYLVKQKYNLDSYPNAMLVSPKNTRKQLEYVKYELKFTDEKMNRYVNQFVAAYEFGGFGDEEKSLRKQTILKENLIITHGKCYENVKDLYTNMYDFNNNSGGPND